jgi:hypothetical protein
VCRPALLGAASRRCALILAAAPSPRCRATLLAGGILAQTELLTFILFWTLSNNMVYLF